MTNLLRVELESNWIKEMRDQVESTASGESLSSNPPGTAVWPPRVTSFVREVFTWVC